MIGDSSLENINNAWPVFVVVDRAKDASRLYGHHPHPQLAPRHALDLRAKVDRRE
jgi:hypothetical protein